nr:unnamed protein product [Digitaria exilis]
MCVCVCRMLWMDGGSLAPSGQTRQGRKRETPLSGDTWKARDSPCLLPSDVVVGPTR